MPKFIVGLAAVALLSAAPASLQNKTFDIYSIDVEGGQATLFVSPSGQSLLVDTGSPGDRDADRIAAAAKQAGLSRLDYVLITHYDGDHVGGAKDLADRLPIGTFIDHGPRIPVAGAPPMSPQEKAGIDRLDEAYGKARSKARHIEASVGDTLPVQGLDIQVVSSRGDVIKKPLAGAGAPNPLCREFTPHERDTTENINSLGIVIGSFGGRFRVLDLGDLTWNTEHDLVCPNNLIGAIDLYVTTHHGLARSGPPVLVHAIRPRVALVNNGSRKGLSRETWETLKSSPGLEDIWQLHYSAQRRSTPRFEEKGDPGGTDANAPELFIANLGEPPPDHSPAYAVKISVRQDGAFAVTNTRDGHSKEYKKQ